MCGESNHPSQHVLHSLACPSQDTCARSFDNEDEKFVVFPNATGYGYEFTKRVALTASEIVMMDNKKYKKNVKKMAKNNEEFRSTFVDAWKVLIDIGHWDEELYTMLPDPCEVEVKGGNTVRESDDEDDEEEEDRKAGTGTHPFFFFFFFFVRLAPSADADVRKPHRHQRYQRHLHGLVQLGHVRCRIGRHAGLYAYVGRGLGECSTVPADGIIRNIACNAQVRGLGQPDFALSSLGGRGGEGK